MINDWRNQALQQATSGQYDPLVIQAAANNPFGLVGDQGLLNPSLDYLYRSQQGQLYQNPEGVSGGLPTYQSSIGDMQLTPISVQDVVNNYWQQGVSGLSPEQWIAANEYVKNSNVYDFVDYLGRVISPGTEIQVDGGSFRYNPKSFTGYRGVDVIQETPGIVTPDMNVPYEYETTQNYKYAYDTSTGAYLPVRDIDNYNSNNPAMFGENWEWTGQGKAPSWKQALYNSGIMPDEQFGGTMGQGAWNAIKGITPAVTGVIGGIANGAMNAGGAAGNAANTGTTISDAASKYLTDLTGISKNIMDPVVGFAGNTLQNAATGGKIDEKSLLMGAAGALGKGVWNEFSSPDVSFNPDMGQIDPSLAGQEYVSPYSGFAGVNAVKDMVTPQSYFESGFNPTGGLLGYDPSRSPFSDNYKGSLLGYDPNSDPFKENFANAAEGISILGPGDKLVIDESLNDPLKYKPVNQTKIGSSGNATQQPSVTLPTSSKPAPVFSEYAPHKWWELLKLDDYDKIVRSMTNASDSLRDETPSLSEMLNKQNEYYDSKFYA